MSRQNITTPVRLLTAGVVAALMLVGCNNDSSSPTIILPNPNGPTVGQNLGSIVGTVVDQMSLTPIVNATITVNGQQFQSDANGRFQLTGLPVGSPVTLTISAEDYPERTFTIVLPNSNPLQVEYQLNNDDTIASVTQSVTQAVTLTIEELGAQVSIPANALQRADGQPIVGDITVSMDVITPATNPDEMPGGYGIVGGGFMESWGALVITATDSDDNDLVLVDNNIASLIIPVSTRSLAPLEAQMPLFFYDEQQQGWVQTGAATLQTLANGIETYVAQVDTIGAWNVDKAMETVDVYGCVADTNGTRINNALVKSDGINYSAVTTTTTNSNGDFALPVRRDGELLVYAQNGNRTSNAKSIITNDNDYRITDGCLTVSTDNDNLSIRLTWGQLPYDVDSHLVTPSGDHIYYGNQGSLSAAPFANLDVDDINSFGPEFVTIRNLMVGRYSYGVDNYSGTQNPGLKDSPISVFLAGPSIRSRTLTPTLNDNNINSEFWHSFDLVVDASCNITYESVDRWLAFEEISIIFDNVTPSTPQYCVAP